MLLEGCYLPFGADRMMSGGMETKLEESFKAQNRGGGDDRWLASVFQFIV